MAYFIYHETSFLMIILNISEIFTGDIQCKFEKLLLKSVFVEISDFTI